MAIVGTKTTSRKSTKKNPTRKATKMAPTTTPEAPAEAKKNRKKKAPFDVTTATVGGKPIKLDENQRLTAIPDNWTSASAPLKKSHFASSDMFHDWRAARIEARITEMTEEAKLERQTAEQIRQGGTPTAQTVKRAKKLQSQLAELQAMLKEQGISLDEM